MFRKHTPTRTLSAPSRLPRQTRARRGRALLSLTLVAAAAALAPAATNAADPGMRPPVATDWTSVTTNTAHGSLLGGGVDLSGTHVWNTPTSRTDGSWPYFSGPDFSPSLAKSDVIQIAGGQGFQYLLRFDQPTTDPIIHLGSLASELSFDPPMRIARLSGQADFTVSGTTVRGKLDSRPGPDGVYDASGTIKLQGTYTKVTFRAQQLYSGPEDGVLVQVVSQPEFADWTAVNQNTARASLLGSEVKLTGAHVWDAPSSVTDGSWPHFGGPDFSPALVRSDAIQIAGGSGYRYTIHFNAPRTDPILHLGSLASRLDFPASVTKVSGQSGFTVSGGSVSGTPSNTLGPDGLSDASGSVLVHGTYTDLTFTATQLYSGQEDGIMIQLGAIR